MANIRNSKISSSLLLTAIVVFSFNGVLAQKTDRQIKPYSCEYNVRTLDVLHNFAQGKELIIAVARLGEGENRKNLNARRLHNVWEYLTSELYWKRDPETVVIAEGKRVKGYGRIEFYVKGILFDVLAVERNGDLLVGSCEPDDIRPKQAERIFYPFRDSEKRSFKKRIKR